MKKNLLFFGELPSKQTHGVSLSNKINLEILNTKYNVTISEETTSLKFYSNHTFYKFIQFYKNIKVFIINIRKKKYDYFYSTLYLSSLGIFKNFISIVIFKLFNSNSKVIFHIHRSDFDVFYKKLFIKIIFKCINQKNTKFIVLSKQQLVYFNQLGISNSFLLYNTIDLKINNIYFDLKSDRRKENYKIVFISNYLIGKGIINLINVFNDKFKDSNASLYCYGNFTNELSENLLRSLTDTNKNIFINGPVNNDEKYYHISNSDLMILPSHNEGVPLVLLESLALNKPILISNVGFIEEVLGSDYPLYCLPNDEDSIYLKIISFLNNINKFSNSEYFSNLYKPFSHENHKLQLLKIFEY
jgi:glycosyltransferase involved in cell wall biosynthesis